MKKKFYIYNPEVIKTRQGDYIDSPSVEEIQHNENLVTSKYEIVAEDIGDDYHTMHELYQHRMALNIALFNLIENVRHWESAFNNCFDDEYKVMKSKLHNDGTMFDGYFIVVALTPAGQISYHYDLKHWDKFKIPEVERIPIPFDGHGSLEVMERLMKL